MNDKIEKVLQTLESPFTWDIPQADIAHFEDFSERQIKKLDNIEEDAENGFHWRKYVLSILLAHEVYKSKNDYKTALPYIESCLEHIHSNMKNNCQDIFFLDTKKALLHVALTTKVHLLLAGQRTEEVTVVLAQVMPVNKMTTQEKAAIFGIKASVYLLYGDSGHKKALQNAKEALNLHSTQAEWNFLVGNAMGRIRRTARADITPDEIRLIEKANELDKDNAGYLVHLGQVYSDQSLKFFYADNDYRSPDKIKSKQFAKDAVMAFKKAVALHPDSPSIKARASHGLIRLKPKDMVDMKYVKQLLIEVMEMAPNNLLVYHDLAYYYDKFENNIDMAIKCLEKAQDQGNNKALLYSISLKWKNKQRNQILKDLEKGLEKYQGTMAQAELLSHLVVYTLLIKEDWKSALVNAVKSLKLDPSGRYFLKYTSHKGGHVNVIEMMMDKLSQNTPRDVLTEYNEFVQLTSSIKLNTHRHTDFDRWKRAQMGPVMRRN